MPELTPLQTSLDELIDLTAEVDREKVSVKAERKGDIAAASQMSRQVQDVAMRTGGRSKRNNSILLRTHKHTP